MTLLISNLSATMSKTLCIEEPLSLDGTHFTANVYADKFMISGATTPAYLMMAQQWPYQDKILKVIFIWIIIQQCIHPLQMQARLDIIMLIIHLLQRFGYHILREGAEVHL